MRLVLALAMILPLPAAAEQRLFPYPGGGLVALSACPVGRTCLTTPGPQDWSLLLPSVVPPDFDFASASDGDRAGLWGLSMDSIVDYCRIIRCVIQPSPGTPGSLGAFDGMPGLERIFASAPERR